MKLTSLRFIVLAVFCLAALTLVASAQDFQQTYQLH